MDAKVLFSVAIRVFGLLALARGAYDLIFVIAFSLGQGDFSVDAKYPGFDMVLGILYSVVGLYLVRGGSHLMAFAFPNDDSELAEDEEDQVQDEIIEPDDKI
jgi:hypothetical protein